MFWLLACTEQEPTDTTTPTDTEPAPTGDTGTETATGDTGTETVVVVDEDWERFVESREGFLFDLGEPILDCVQRQDTSNPAFHGCIDWHSAVHGTWALHVLYRLTEDTAYLDAADAILTTEALAQELENMEQGFIAGEIPYGFSWFLLLARERESSTGEIDLVPLAAEAYAQLATFVDTLPQQVVDDYVLSDEYSNLSWTLLQLWEQAVWNGDTAQQLHWEDYVRTKLLPLDNRCPLEDDAQSTGFFPACLHRARTIALVLPEDEVNDWLISFLPTVLPLAPRTSFPALHQAGQNFSRSWGLWTLWSAAGDSQYRDLYIAHITTHMTRPEYWAENYAFYSHWVAQFGVYGISLSYE